LVWHFPAVGFEPRSFIWDLCGFFTTPEFYRTLATSPPFRGEALSAHLGLNWDRYTGTEEEFATAASELLAFIRLDVRNRIVRRYPLSFRCEVHVAWSECRIASSPGQVYWSITTKSTFTAILVYSSWHQTLAFTSLPQISAKDAFAHSVEMG